MARLFRHPRSRFWWMEYQERGKKGRTRESTGKLTEREAKKLLESRLKDLGSGRPVGPAAERVHYENLEKLLLDDYSLNGRKWKIGCSLKHLERAFANERAIGITSQAVTDYAKSRLANSAAPASVNRELALLRRMFKLAAISGLLSAGPYIKLLPEHNRRTVYFSHAEAMALRAAFQVEAYRDYFDALYATGVRRTQMARLEWRDVMDGAVTFRGETTKNQEPHTLPLFGEFGAAIERARTYRLLSCPFVFHHDGAPFCYADGSLSQPFRAAWAAALRDSGLVDRRLHDLRRSAATHLAESGTSEQVAKVITGHKSDMYRRYNIVQNDVFKRALERLEEYRAELPTKTNVVTLRKG